MIRGTASAPKISPSAAAFANGKSNPATKYQDRVPACSFLWRGTLQQFGQDWNKWNAIIEALSDPSSVAWRLVSENRRRHSFIELDFVAEEGELRSEGFFLRETTKNFHR